MCVYDIYISYEVISYIKCCKKNSSRLKFTSTKIILSVFFNLRVIYEYRRQVTPPIERPNESISESTAAGLQGEKTWRMTKTSSVPLPLVRHLRRRWAPPYLP